MIGATWQIMTMILWGCIAFTLTRITSTMWEARYALCNMYTRPCITSTYKLWRRIGKSHILGFTRDFPIPVIARDCIFCPLCNMCARRGSVLLWYQPVIYEHNVHRRRPWLRKNNIIFISMSTVDQMCSYTYLNIIHSCTYTCIFSRLLG